MLSLLAVAAFLSVSQADTALVHTSGPGKILFDGTNTARTDVGVNKLKWDNGLAENAKRHGMKLGCNLVHTTPEETEKAGEIPGTQFHVPAKWTVNNQQRFKYGENLAWSWNRNSEDGAQVAAEGWNVEEKGWYKLADNQCHAPADKTCNHYIQSVWRETEYMGCAELECGKERLFACQYWPAADNSERPTDHHKYYDASSSPLLTLEIPSNMMAAFMGLTVLNTLLILGMCVWKNRTQDSSGYHKQLAQTDYDTEEEQQAINQVV